MVRAGWTFNGATSTPLQMEFTEQVVNFNEFLKAAPEADWNGALSGMAVTCASLAAAVLAFMF